MRREGNSGAGIVIAAIGLVVLLPVVYVLSIGPAVRLVEHGMLSETAAEAIYTPVITLVEICPPLEAPFSMYIEMWEPGPVYGPASCPTPNPAPAPSLPPLPPPLPTPLAPSPS